MSQSLYIPRTSPSTSMDDYEPPVTPVRPTLELLPPPPGPRNLRKRAPPSPLDATFSAARRNHLFTLSTATNIGLGSPSTPTAPLLPAAPIFMPMPVTPTPSKLSSSPMRRSPGIRNFSKFTFDAFNEDQDTRIVDENTWIPSAASPSSSSSSCSPLRTSMPNSLGLFDFYREESSPEFSSPELPGSPSSFSDPTGSLWEDESDASCSSPLSPSAIVFARRVSLDLASPSTSNLSRSMPSLASLPTSNRDPVLGSPVPSLSSSISTSASSPSSRSSPCGSDTSLSSCSFTPSPTTKCLATFSSTSFFDSPPAPPCPPKSIPSFSKTSPLAQRRMESLSRRRLQKLQISASSSASSTAATPASSPTSSGLGLFA
ncbi:uncharacterized protein JCM6883_001829 [Sporobolomyces salmoneus]|uniref:uncharacterized protein n=1 Tax=Sporobolomyces salmoneus TaxID=183962 RepID=UPI00316D6DF2